MNRNFDNAKNIVIKVGTSVVTEPDGALDRKRMQDIAMQSSNLVREGRVVVLVSSGAIGSGVKELGLPALPNDIPTRQAAAAVGQSILMEAWRTAFRKCGLKVAQILLTYEAFSNRRTYLNLRNSMAVLNKCGTIPIVNENDPISVHEIEATFGDNDRLSALLAANMDSQLLILLTDVNGLYNKNPRHGDAKLISEIKEITSDIERMGGGPDSSRSKGGMRTKIEAAKIATSANCAVIIANAREDDVVTRVVNGEAIGTCFMPLKAGYRNRERWIRYSISNGSIEVDENARTALLHGGSLLPSGIVEVKGDFDVDSIVSITHRGKEIARGLVDYSSEELDRIKGKRTDAIEKILGYRNYDNVVRRENMAFLRI